MNIIDFDLNQELNGYQPTNANDVTTTMTSTKGNFNFMSEPSLILVQENWDLVRSWIDRSSTAEPHQFAQFATSTFTCLEKHIDNTRDDILDKAWQNYEQDKKIMQALLFVWFCIFNAGEARLSGASTTTTVKTGGKKKAATSSSGESIWKASLRAQALETIHRFILLNLDVIFMAASERDLVINDLVFKCVRLCLESADSLKAVSTKSTISDIFCHCALKYESSFKSLMHHLQDFLREDHLCEFVAEIMDSSIVDYENPLVADFILKEVAGKLYTDKDQDKLSKTTSKFLLRISEIQPKQVMKSMVHLNDLLDSESSTIRAVMIDVIANVLHIYLANEEVEVAANNIQNFYEILSQRFLDTAALVRTRVLKVLIKLTQRHKDSPGISDIPLSYRQSLVQLCIQRLKDKSSVVRKKALELMVAFMETSPFIAIPQDRGSLSYKKFNKHVDELLAVIKEKMPKEAIPAPNDDMEIVEEGEKEEPPQSQLSQAAQTELSQLQALLTYYQDASAFSSSVNVSCETIAELLGSALKTEVICAMRFFVTAHRFELEGAQIGVCQMVHKIWDKDSDKEAGSVRDVLVGCFYDIHMTPTPSPTGTLEELIARNLTDLVASMDLAQQTSLEELISTMAAAMDKIPARLPETLWKIFSSSKASMERKKNVLLLLGMIGKSNKNVLGDNLDVLTRNGLCDIASNDYSVAKYACVALQQLYHVRRQKGVYTASMERKTIDHPTCERICSLILRETKSNTWFSFAAQAINALYLMVEQPDKVCGDLIKEFTNRVFTPTVDDLDSITTGLQNNLKLNEEDVEGEDSNEHEDAATVVPDQSQRSSEAFKLSQLLFFVGHVAIKQIVHLESIETEWKRRKSDKEAKNKNKTGELDMVTGSVEDEFVDTVAMVREREILFGPNSLLSLYGPMIVHVLSHNQKFKDNTLQTMASLSLCKFMCISSDFCEAHLNLLFAVADYSNDPKLRSNMIIGMGDLAICFNSLIDENIGQLYNRLKDSNFSVKKNTLMVLTFLILNGMIKVKGQISEMAKCVEDSDPKIRELAKAFFKELSTKDNAIYNNLPDIISNLASVDETRYKSIVKFLFGFILKEKQNENIVDKLCLRFKHAETERQWSDIGFCLSLLSFGTEKSLKKLIEHFPLYQDKLYVPALFKYLSDIIGKVSKGKQEWKAVVDDFKEKLTAAQSKAIEDHEAALSAGNQERSSSNEFKFFKETLGTSSSPGMSSLPEVAKKVPSRQRRRTAAEDDDDNDDDDDEEEEDEEQNEDEENEDDLLAPGPVAKNAQEEMNDEVSQQQRQSQKDGESDSDDTADDVPPPPVTSKGRRKGIVKKPLTPVKKGAVAAPKKAKAALPKAAPAKRSTRRTRIIDSDEDDLLI